MQQPQQQMSDHDDNGVQSRDPQLGKQSSVSNTSLQQPNNGQIDQEPKLVYNTNNEADEFQMLGSNSTAIDEKNRESQSNQKSKQEAKIGKLAYSPQKEKSEFQIKMNEVHQNQSKILEVVNRTQKEIQRVLNFFDPQKELKNFQQESYKETDSNISVYKKQTEQYKTHLQQLQNTLDKQRGEWKSKQATLHKRHQDNIAQIKITNQIDRTSILAEMTELQSKLKSLEKEIIKTKEQLQNEKSNTEFIKQSVESKENELAQLKLQLKSIKQEKERKQAEIEQFLNINKTLKKQLQTVCRMDKCEPSETQFKELITKLQNTLLSEKQQTDTLNQRFSDLKLDLKKANQQKEGKEREVDQLIETLKKQLQKACRMEKFDPSETQFKDSITKLQSTLLSGKQQTDRLSKTLTHTKQELKKTNQQKEGKEREVEQLVATLKKQLQKVCRMEKFEPSETQFKDSIKILQSTLCQGKQQTDRLTQKLTQTKQKLKKTNQQKEGKEIQIDQLIETLKKQLQKASKMEKFEPSQTQFKDSITKLQSTLLSGKQQTDTFNKTLNDANLQLNAFKGVKFQSDDSLAVKIRAVFNQYCSLHQLERNLGEITRNLGALPQKEKDQTKQCQRLRQIGQLYPIQYGQYELVSCIQILFSSAIHRKEMLLTECCELVGGLNKGEKEKDKVTTRKAPKDTQNISISETQFKESLRILQNALLSGKKQIDKVNKTLQDNIVSGQQQIKKLTQTLSDVNNKLKGIKEEKENKEREVEQLIETLKKQLQKVCKMEKFEPSETQFKDSIMKLQNTLFSGKQQTDKLTQTLSDANDQLNKFKGVKFQLNDSLTNKITTLLKQYQLHCQVERNLKQTALGLVALSQKEKDQTKQRQRLMKLGESYPIQCGQYNLVSCIQFLWSSAIDKKEMQIEKYEDLLTECFELVGSLSKSEKDRDRVLTQKTSKGVENERLQTIKTELTKVSKTLKKNSDSLSQQIYSNDTLRKTNKQLEDKKNNVEAQNRTNQSDIAKLKKDLSEKQGSYQQLKKQLQTESIKSRDLNISLQKLRSESDKKSADLKAQSTKVKSLQSEIQRNKVDLQKRSGELIIQKKTVQSLKDQTQTLIVLIKNLQKQNSDLTTEITKSKSDAERLRGERDNLRIERESLNGEKDRLSKQVSDNKANIKNLSEDIKKNKNQITSLNDNKKVMQAQKTSLQVKIRDLNSTLDSRKSQISVLQTDKRNLEVKINEQKTKYQILDSKYNETDKKLSEEKRERKIQVDEICETVNRQLSNITKKDHKLRAQDLKQQLPKQFDIMRLNMGRRLCPESVILENQDKDKIEFLSQSLQKGRGRIKFCQLLYRFDTISKVNFHTYIDNQRNVLLIVKVVNGHVLGGFTSEPPNQVHTPGDGFLYSLTNNFVLDITTKNSKMAKVITPDDLNIIFGNSELRIKVTDDMIFSNLGLLQAYFNDKDKGKKVQDLLGQGVGVKNAKMVTYEFYQITFG